MKKTKFVSASELAEMGYCEKKMLFELCLGRRISPERMQAQAQGTAAHQQFHRDATVSSPYPRLGNVKPWCFIASELFGPKAAETVLLRQFRDMVLRKYSLGRAFVRIYYQHSPTVAGWMHRHRFARAVTRAVLRPLVLFLRWLFHDIRWERKERS